MDRDTERESGGGVDRKSALNSKKSKYLSKGKGSSGIECHKHVDTTVDEIQKRNIVYRACEVV